jgi:hypothetical protein
LGFGGGGEGFGEVDFEDFGGDGVVDPALFDEGNEEGAGFFDGFEVEGVEGPGVGVGLDGSGGGEDEDLVLWGVLWWFERNAGILPLRLTLLAQGQNDTSFGCAGIAG